MLSEALWKSAGDVEALLRRQGFQFCFIGGLAIQRWGEPRSTRDLDLTLLTGFGTERPYIESLLEQFAPRVEDATGFALRTRVLLLRDSSGVPIDIALGAMPFEERSIERSSAFEADTGVVVTTCSAEDLIVHKAFASRAQDWIDVRSILVRSGAAIERDLIREELSPLAELKEDPTILPRLEALFAQT